MNARHRWMLVILVAAGGALMLAASARRLGSARAERRLAETALAQCLREAREIAELLGRRQTIEMRQRPAQDVIALVNAALAEVGIPSHCFKSLTPESEGAGAPTAPTTGDRGLGQLKQQLVRLVLEDLSPEQVGQWLAHWRSAYSIWIPIRIELVHNRRTSGDGNRFDVTIQLAALYVDRGDSKDPA